MYARMPEFRREAISKWGDEIDPLAELHIIEHVSDCDSLTFPIVSDRLIHYGLLTQTTIQREDPPEGFPEMRGWGYGKMRARDIIVIWLKEQK